MQSKFLRNRGFTLIQVIALVAVGGAVSLIAAQYVSKLVVAQKAEETLTKLNELKTSIYGDNALYNQAQKSFLLDLRRLPTSLEELANNINDDPDWDGPYWLPESFTSGTSESTVSDDAFGNEIGWEDSTGTFLLDEETLTTLEETLGEQVVQDLKAAATPAESDLEANLFGAVEGTVIDLTGFTFPHSWHKGKVLISLLFMGNDFLSIEIDLEQERRLFFLHNHGERYVRIHPDDDVEDEADDVESDEEKITNNMDKPWWRLHDHDACEFEEDEATLKDLKQLTNYLVDLPLPEDKWFDHRKLDHLGIDGPHLKLGTIKHNQKYRQGRNYLLNEEFADLITVHPAQDGSFFIENVSVGNYIITAYDNLLIDTLTTAEKAQLPPNAERKLRFKRVDEALKRYLVVRPNKTGKVNFGFTHLFPGNQKSVKPDPKKGKEETPTATMVDDLEITVNSWTIATDRYSGLTFGNDGDGDIVIDKIAVDWDNTGSSQRSKLRDIQINGSSVWPSGGDKNHGTTVNINDVTLSVGSSSVPFFLLFKDDRDAGASLRFTFTMSDDSKKEFAQDSPPSD